MHLEHISTVLPPTLGAAAPAVTSAPGIPREDLRRPSTLADLVARLAPEEDLENPDVVTESSSLRLTDEGLLDVPRLGCFTFTDWSRRQCASLVGLKWDRWFENASGRDQAEELNRRFARATGQVRLRTRRAPGSSEADGELRAIVSPTYSPVPDSVVASKLLAALGPGEHRLVRSDLTDRTTSYVVKLGDAFEKGDADARVGDVWGGVLVRNSGVGFASLMVTLHLTRILCLNGMTAPAPDALVLRRRHRGLDVDAIESRIGEGLRDVGPRLHQSARRLVAGLRRAVPNVEAELRSILRDARLPLRLLRPLLDAHAKEPLPNAFGVSQALTLAAQGLSPEERFELERAAGRYLSS